MAQEKTFIAVRWAALSKPGIDRYVIKNKDTDEVVDDNHGKGYQSPKAAHASFAFKQKYRGWKSTGIPDGKRIPIHYGTSDGKPDRPAKRKSSNQRTKVTRNAQNKKPNNQHGLFD